MQTAQATVKDIIQFVKENEENIYQIDDSKLTENNSCSQASNEKDFLFQSSSDSSILQEVTHIENDNLQFINDCSNENDNHAIDVSFLYEKLIIVRKNMLMILSAVVDGFGLLLATE